MTSSDVRTRPESLLWQTNTVRALMITGHYTDDMLLRFSPLFSSLEQLGINAIIIEIDYHFDFKSHPELCDPVQKITWKGARYFTKKAKKHGITIIPLFHILGNQSEGSQSSPLLTAYPSFDATPAQFPKDSGIHSREWDPLNEKIEHIIFGLLEELIDAFAAPAIHIGMGEIFLLGHPSSPSTHEKNPAVVFAYVVNAYRQFLIYNQEVSVLMFADRLIDGHVHDFGPWESSYTGTAEAIDLIPRDVIICPWHITPRFEYPSIPEFTQRGFRILPTCWHDIDATVEYVNYCLSLKDEHILGFMFSLLNVKTADISVYQPLLTGLATCNTKEDLPGT